MSSKRSMAFMSPLSRMLRVGASAWHDAARFSARPGTQQTQPRGYCDKRQSQEAMHALVNGKEENYQHPPAAAARSSAYSGQAAKRAFTRQVVSVIYGCWRQATHEEAAAAVR